MTTVQYFKLRRAVRNKSRSNLMNEKIIAKVFKMLQARQIDPEGHFDIAGIFHLVDKDLISVQPSSRYWPLREWNAGRTKDFVRKVAVKYEAYDEESLLYFITGVLED